MEYYVDIVAFYHKLTIFTEIDELLCATLNETEKYFFQDSTLSSQNNYQKYPTENGTKYFQSLTSTM